MTRELKNFGASVRARLQNLAKAQKRDFELTLQRYVAERFLYRLGVSPHRDRFVLKGAMLFVLWDEGIARSTKDLDLAGFWANDAASLAQAFREICAISYPSDGLAFIVETLTIAPIRTVGQYHGFRLKLDVRLASARIPFQVDVGFGDVITPAAVDAAYPVLLDGDAPWIRAYPREAVLAEKLHAMAIHGNANTRYKDFFDVYTLSSRYAFVGAVIASAIAATFSQRKSTFSPWPVALTSDFYANALRADQWDSYLTRAKLAEQAPRDFAIVGERVQGFLEPPVRAVSNGDSFELAWAAGGPWQSRRAGREGTS